MTYIARFDKRLRDIPPEIVSKLASVDESKGRFMSVTSLSPQFINRLKRSVLVTSTGASTRIEGSRLSDEEVDKLMHGVTVDKFTDRDEQEIRGYFELLHNVFKASEVLSLNENTIKHLHKELLKYVEKDELHRGKYKSRENQVRIIDPHNQDKGILFDTTPAYLTPKEMNELVDWTRDAFNIKKYHPILIVANFIVEFLNIHPFEDGNGRLSRILTNLLLLKVGYTYMPYVSHEKLIEENKLKYYLALRTSQKTFKSNGENISTWLDFFLEILLSQSKLAVNLINQESVDILLSPKQLAVWQYMQEVAIASPNEIAKYAKIARPTVNQVLNKLLSLKKIERIGEGAATRYRKIL